MYNCFNNLINFYLKKNNLWQSKEKYLYDYLSSFDLPFANQLKEFLIENDNFLKYQKIQILKSYVLKDVSPLDKNWKSPKFY